MKNISILLLILLSIPLLMVAPPVTRAGDCFQDPIYERNWNAEVTTGARVRNVACMEGSEVVATLPVGEVVTVIAETDGWYKIRRGNGTEGWVGTWLLTATDKAVSGNTPPPVVTETAPLWDIQNHPYETAIRYLYDAGIIRGYSDGSFKPGATINRAEFTKIVSSAQFGGELERWVQCRQSYDNGVDSCRIDGGVRGGCAQSVWNQLKSCLEPGLESHTGAQPSETIAMNFIQCFPDIGGDTWFSKYVCFAKAKSILAGYPDGSFKPANTINFVESAAIIVQAFGLNNTPGEPWYKSYVDELAAHSSIPLSIIYFNQNITRGEMAEIIYRLKLEVTTKPSQTYADLLP